MLNRWILQYVNYVSIKKIVFSESFHSIYCTWHLNPNLLGFAHFLIYIINIELIQLPFPRYSRAAVPNLFGTRDWFRGRQFFHWVGGEGDGAGGNAGDGERWGAMGSGRWSFAHSPAACLLLRGPVPNRPWTHSQGLGSPALGNKETHENTDAIFFFLKVLKQFGFLILKTK